MTNSSSCILCGSTTEPILDLGDQVLANSLECHSEPPQKRYPLFLHRCLSCTHLQLNTLVDPSLLFTEYCWVTGTSKAARRFSYQFFNEVKKRSPNSKSVLEIASNDGTFLRPFLETGHNAIGIDPAQNLTKLANENGILTHCDFFSLKSAEFLTQNYSPDGFDIVIARNVIAHTPDPLSMLEGIRKCLSPSGLAFVEYHDAFHILESFQYDSIYHEHYSYFSLKSFKKAAELSGLFILDYFDSPISGGASVVILGRQNNDSFSTAGLDTKMNKDSVIGLYTSDRWIDFATNSQQHSSSLLHAVSEISRSSQIIGYGSSARSNTLLQYSGISNNMIKFIIDNNKLKQGRLTPGTRIPIKSIDSFLQYEVVVLLLAWNFSSEIIEQLKLLDRNDISVIQPLPGKVKTYPI